MPSAKPASAAPDLLEYLRDLGYEDLYRGSSGSAEPTERREVPRAESSREAPGDAPSRLAPSALFEASTAFDDLSFAELEHEALGCRRCRLCETRNKVVFGSGHRTPRLLFIGEGPGAEEDKQGLPFVGRAGELLTKIVHAIGMTREEVYIANVVKCRPPGNREPAPDEVAACRGFLDRQIDLLRPRVIVALGRVAAQTVLGSDTAIGKLRGHWFETRGVPLRATYHPAALLRNPDLKRPTWEDMQIVRDRLRQEDPGERVSTEE